MDYKKFTIVMFMGLFGIVSWNLLFYIISKAIIQGGSLGVISLRFNKYNEMIIVFWLSFVVFYLYIGSIIYIWIKGVD